MWVGNSHARCGAGENLEIISKSYLSLFQIVQKLGGFSLGQADLLRRAMGKKLSDEEMEKLSLKFIDGEVDHDGNIVMPGCVRNGITRKNALDIWNLMKDFNKYAFNKSHSAGYAVIAVRTAFLKYYYPVDFMAATLNAYIIDSDKVIEYLAACNYMGIEVLPPSLDNSQSGFSKVDNNTILFGFKGIKYISSMAQRIVDERNERDAFSSLQDFAERMAKYEKIDKRVMEGLIYSGATDNFGYTRNSLLNAVPTFLAAAKREKDVYDRGQTTLFDLMSNGDEFTKIKIDNIPEYDKRFKLEKEKEFTGYYLSEHPLDSYAQYFTDEDITESMKLRVETEVDEITGEVTIIDSEVKSETEVKVAGIIVDKKVVYTKKDNKAMAIIQVEDRTGTIDMVVFPGAFSKYGHLLAEGSVLLFEGLFNLNEDKSQVIVNAIIDLDRMLKTPSTKNLKALGISIFEESQFKELNSLINANKGDIPVYVKMKGVGYKAKNSISTNLTTLLSLEKIAGSDNLKMIY